MTNEKMKGLNDLIIQYEKLEQSILETMQDICIDNEIDLDIKIDLLKLFMTLL